MGVCVFKIFIYFVAGPFPAHNFKKFVLEEEQDDRLKPKYIPLSSCWKKMFFLKKFTLLNAFSPKFENFQLFFYPNQEVFVEKSALGNVYHFMHITHEICHLFPILKKKTSFVRKDIFPHDILRQIYYLGINKFQNQNCEILQLASIRRKRIRGKFDLNHYLPL